ncbi:zinc finger protein 83-like [Ochlerotatus camptorhynchus]|uniref:zinc finger protein 83-like n=1 Tax=Ochlerotatus camptorhynchus TaxID=644619 RepID=UPI0031CDD21B
MSMQIEQQHVCRICLQDARVDYYEPINMFEPKLEQSEFPLVEALTVICGLNVTKEDDYPKLICLNCLSQLRDAFKLRLLAQRSQELFSSILCNTITKSKPEYKSVDVLSDDVLKSKFFDESVTVKSDAEDHSNLQRIYCCGCDESFDSEQQLRRHSNHEHRPKKLMAPTKRRMISCHVCYVQMKEDDWEAHRAGKNALKSLMVCDFCKCNFTTTVGMNKHHKMYHANGLYKCCGCSFKSKIKSELEEHSLLHEKGDPKGTTRTKKYKCSICYVEFKSFEEIRMHDRLPYRRAKQSENDANKLTESSSVTVCCGCVKVFKSISQLKEHQQNEHKQESVPNATDPLSVQCNACHKRFSHKRLLKQHMHSTSKKKFFGCSECPVTRRSIDEVLDHATTHTGAKAFLCCGCQRGFCSKEELKQHSLEEHAIRPKFYHDDDYEQKRPFLCDICYRRYKSKLDLVHHQQLVYDAKVHMCEVCGKGFHQARTLDLHMATHVEQADHPCFTCGKKYRHETLARHCMLRHKRPTEHRCRICQAVFSDSSNLNSHLISHSDVRKHKCQLCEETFKRPGHLRMHMETAHTQESNFRCRHCSKQFSTPSTLKRHEIDHTGKYPYRCEVCGKPFKTRKYYVEHYEKHIGESAKVYRCHLCEERYSRQYFLSNHLKFSHRIEPTEVGWNAKFKQTVVSDGDKPDDAMEDGGEQGTRDKV